MHYTIETSLGFVKAYQTLCGEISQVTEYTSNRDSAKQLTQKQIKSLCLKRFFRYHSMAIIIAEV